MVQEDDKDRSFPKEKFISIWFVKALAFLSFNLDLVNSGTSAKRTMVKLKGAESVNEYCFIQYYDVLTKTIVSLEKLVKPSGAKDSCGKEKMGSKESYPQQNRLFLFQLVSFADASVSYQLTR